MCGSVETQYVTKIQMMEVSNLPESDRAKSTWDYLAFSVFRHGTWCECL